LWITRGRIRQWFEAVVQVADLNGGNAPEIIGLANSGAAVVVLRNLGNVKYGPAAHHCISGQPNGIAVGGFQREWQA
jgi:hypothetical protein